MSDDKKTALSPILDSGQRTFLLYSQEVLGSLKINSKSIADLKKEFFLDVNPLKIQTPQDCISLGAEILSKYEQASFALAVSQAKLNVIKRGSEMAFLSKFNSLVEKYKAEKKKLPAKDTLVSLAQFEVQEIETSLCIAELETRFWKDILNGLDIARKLLETLSMNIAVERKIMSAPLTY